MKKKILSALLALSMVASLLPMTAMAADATVDSSSKIHGVLLSSITPTADSDFDWSDSDEKINDIELRPAQMAGNYDKDGTKITVDTSAGSATLWYVSGSMVSSVLKDHGSSATLEELLTSKNAITEKELNEKALVEGDLVVIKSSKDSTNKWWLLRIKKGKPDDKGELDMTKSKMKLNEDLNAHLTSPIADPENAKLKTGEGGYYSGFAAITKADAASIEKNHVFIGKLGETAVARVSKTPLSEQSDHVNVVAAFDGGTDLTSQGSLVRGEDGNAWVIIRVTTEAGNFKYYVVKVPIKSDDASLKGLTISYKNPTNEVKKTLAGGEGGSESDPQLLTIKVPYNDEKYLNQINTLKFSLTLDGSIPSGTSNVKWWSDAKSDQKQAVNVNSADEELNISTAEIAASQDLDLTEGKAVYISIKSEDGSVTKYYKVKAVTENPSSDAVLTQAVIRHGSNENAYPAVAVSGNLSATGGSGEKPIELTGNVPYSADGSLKENVKVVVRTSDNATVDWIAYSNEQSPSNNNLFKDHARTNNDGAYEIAVNAATTPHIYIKVTAEDKKTENVYHLEIGQAEESTEAKITGITVQNEMQNIKGVTVAGLEGEPSNNKANPTEVRVGLPAGSDAWNLSAELTFSPGADVTYYDTDSTYATPAAFLNNIKIKKDVPVYLTVIPQAPTMKDKVSYYKVLVTVGTVEPDQTPSDDTITVDPASPNAGKVGIENGKVVVDSAIDAQTLLGALKSDSAITITDAAGNDVTGTGVVGTGYTVSDGETELKVVVKGDVTKDGRTGLADALTTLKASRGSVTLDDLQQEAADVDNNNSVSLADALKILKSAR